MIPKVSIIVPIYNVEKYIERCACSLFRQSLDDVELIFIDDCSSDRSMEILESVIKDSSLRIRDKHWAIKIERMPMNCGQSVARKNGLHLATGNYVLYCDSDDWMEENMVGEMWDMAEKDDLDVVVCDYNHVGSSGSIRHCGMKSNDADSFFHEVLAIQSSWALWNKMFKRSLYQQVLFPDSGMNMGEDMVMTIQLLYHCSKVGYVNKAFYNYCENKESITNRTTVAGIIDNYIQWYSNICFLESCFKKKETDVDLKGEISHICSFATSGVMEQLGQFFSSNCSLMTKLSTEVLCNTNITCYGKVQFVRLMTRKFFSSGKNTIKQLIRCN